jgi:hypothetical protein
MLADCTAIPSGCRREDVLAKFEMRPQGVDLAMQQQARKDSIALHDMHISQVAGADE